MPTGKMPMVRAKPIGFPTLRPPTPNYCKTAFSLIIASSIVDQAHATLAKHTSHENKDNGGWLRSE